MYKSQLKKQKTRLSGLNAIMKLDLELLGILQNWQSKNYRLGILSFEHR